MISSLSGLPVLIIELGALDQAQAHSQCMYFICIYSVCVLNHFSSDRQNLPNPIEPASLMSPALARGFFTTSTTWETHMHIQIYFIKTSSSLKKKTNEGYEPIVYRGHGLHGQQILIKHHPGTRDKNRARLVRNLLLLQENWLKHTCKGWMKRILKHIFFFSDSLHCQDVGTHLQIAGQYWLLLNSQTGIFAVPESECL